MTSAGLIRLVFRFCLEVLRQRFSFFPSGAWTKRKLSKLLKAILGLGEEMLRWGWTPHQANGAGKSRERSWILVTSLGSWIMPHLKPQQIQPWIWPLCVRSPFDYGASSSEGCGGHCWHGKISFESQSATQSSCEPCSPNLSFVIYNMRSSHWNNSNDEDDVTIAPYQALSACHPLCWGFLYAISHLVGPTASWSSNTRQLVPRETESLD